LFCVCSTALATDTAVPDNPTTTSPDTLDLSDGTITSPFGGCPSGTTPAHVNTSNWGTETVRFGECVNTFAITYAINQALQGTGISIDKVHYSWRYVMCFNTPSESGCNTNISNRVNTTTGEVTNDTYFDELQVVIEITDSSGNVVETKTWNMDTWYQWNAANSHSDNEINVGGVYWQIEEGNIELFNHIDKSGTIYTPNALGGVRFRINGQDKGNWDGYFGPVVNRLQTWFTYRANPCDSTAMYDPSCPGYAEAYAAWEYDTNCSANALYDPGCPGYSTAYYNQQCSADPLYDSGCDGYATAYYNQQCSADPLYDSGCDGYEQAYLTQQCNLDSHYSSSCPNYNFAIDDFTDPLENVAGQGSDFIEIVKASGTQVWWPLYYNESELDSGEWIAKCYTYDNGCEDAVISSVTFNGGPNPYAFLYTKDKDGNTFIPTNGHYYRFMTNTKFEEFCDSNALYSPMCDGYATAYFNQQCGISALYNSECTGYAEAYLAQQCSISALHDSSCDGYAEAYLAQQCSLNPLHDSSCSGYATAYFNQQCSLDALYNSECPGYATAYFNQQCSLDATYNSECPGYESAYFTQQCNANPLYDSACSGYDAAYFTQQCTANPLYNSECSGYDTAYFNQQCGLDALYNSECSGYDEAYLAQQCSINTLYDSSCNGYEEAYTLAQCSENPLYAESCEGYDISYFNQQCSFDPQYDTQCPGYQAPIEETVDPVAIDDGTSTGDAIVDNILATPDLPIIDIMPTPQPIPEIQIQSVPDVTVVPDIPEVTTESVIQDLNIEIDESEINNGLPEIQQDAQEEEPSSDVEQSMGGDEPNAMGDASGGQELSETNEDIGGDTNEEESIEEDLQEETNDETVEENESSEPEEDTESTEEEATEENEPSEEETTEEELSDDENVEEDTEEEANEDEATEEEENDESDEETEKEVTDAKPSKKIKLTAKQKADAKRKKIKELVTKRLKELAKTMGEANSLETQKNLQNYIIALLGFKPDFVNYNTQYPDNYYYDDRDLNQDKKVPENQRGLRNGLASEILHEKMVDEQYVGME